MGKKASDYGDPRHPIESDYDSLTKAVRNHTPGDVTPDEFNRAYEEACSAFRKNELWTAPDGTRIEALRHEREMAYHDGNHLACSIVGYRKLRDTEWFVAKDGEVLWGPLRTYRQAKIQVGVKSARSKESGWYRARGHDIFRRDMAETVLGRKLTEEER